MTKLCDLNATTSGVDVVKSMILQRGT